ncbi:MAG: carbon monoxide dehydrogenase subunit G [Rhodoferax sp.]|nr:carbon monoxide dehydrogenase subunit G [Rhodoferax sp.]
MDMQGSRTLAITQQQAWDALNDPAVLKACIPGCDKVELSGENQYAMAMALKIGPVAARFTGKITLSDIQPPNSYTLAFEGQGGAAGFGKGSAQVKLGAPAADSAGGCELAYTVHASVGGKMAQLGQRLVDGAAKSMAEDFFRRFDAAMQQQYPQAYADKAPALPVAPQRPGGVPAWLWLAGALALAAGVWWLLGRA